MTKVIHRTNWVKREYQGNGILELIVADEMCVLSQKLAESGRNQSGQRMKARQKFTTRRLLQPYIDGQTNTRSSCNSGIQCRT